MRFLYNVMPLDDAVQHSDAPNARGFPLCVVGPALCCQIHHLFGRCQRKWSWLTKFVAFIPEFDLLASSLPSKEGCLFLYQSDIKTVNLFKPIGCSGSLLTH